MTGITSIKVKATNTEKDRKNIMLVDDSKLGITASLWGKHASADLQEG